MEENTKINDIKKALDEIRPFLQSDGGDIEFISYEEGIVTVRLLGNCNHCSVNQMTLKSGVEMTIKQHLPEVKEVINIA